MKLPFFLGLVAMLTIVIVDCGDARNTTTLVAPAPYDGPYCSKLDREDYKAASSEEKTSITDAIAGVRDANREILWSHPAVNSLGIGSVPVSGGREEIGIRVGYDKAALRPGEPSPEDLIPKTIGCVNVQVRAGGIACTAILKGAGARVVDDQSGASIKGAYWQSKTEEGVVVVEIEEGGDHLVYSIADDITLKNAGGLPSSVHPITVKVHKDGYQPAERIFRITTDRCHIQDGGRPRVIRLVRDNAEPRRIVQAPPKPEGLPGSMLATAQVLAGVRLLDGRFLVAGGGKGQSMQDTQIYDPHTGTWSFSDSMDRARPNGVATILSDGRVLVIGGVDRVIRLRSAEVFDVSTGKWSPTADMNEGRWNPTATLLQNGKVLVIGGGGSAELYDPGADTWAYVDRMSQARSGHTATLLEDGRVLVVGGSNEDPFTSAEIYDPSQNAWTTTTPMSTPRVRHTATLLQDGRVLVVGGNVTRGGGSMTALAEIFDPATEAWMPAADKHVRVTGHTAILLADGRALVTGDQLSSPDAVNSDGYPLGTLVPIAEIYDPGTDSWSFTGQMTRRRNGPQATLLEDGTVLVVGGSSSRSTPRPSADIYYPATNTWSPTDRFSRDRFGHTETILGNGSVLIAGGMSGDPEAPTLATTAQVYDPSARYFALADDPAQARYDHVATMLFDGTVLVVGGRSLEGSMIASAEIFDPSSGTWRSAGQMQRARRSPVVNILLDGSVLVRGGFDDEGWIDTAEAFDPATNTWTEFSVAVPTISSLPSTLLWRYETGSVGSSPTVAGGVVYQGSGNDYLYALDAATGDLLWRYETGGRVHSSPTVDGGVAYVGSNDNHLYALDAATGDLLWRYETGRIVHSSPTVDGGVVYVGSVDDYLYAVDAATGDLLWRYETGSSVWSSPTVAGGVVYVGSWDYYLYALDATTGDLLWRYETGDDVFSSPTVAGGVVYVGSVDDYLYALDAATGDLLWRYETAGRVHSSPTVAGGVVYVGSYDNYLYALDAATGDLLWRYETGDDVDSSPTVNGGVVYVGSRNDHLYALDAATGDLLWRYEAGAMVLSSPTVDGGVVYVGSAGNGYLDALVASPPR